MAEREDIPPALDAPLRACALGREPPNIALMHLLSAASAEREATRALDRRIQRAQHGSIACTRLERLRDLWRQTPAAFATVKQMNALSHNGAADWSCAFDRAARVSPEAAVALYSLGDAQLLARATHELVTRMSQWGLLNPDATVLDLGTGIGRIATAIAPHVGRVVAVDASRAMANLARARTRDRGNVLVVQGGGKDLSLLADGAFNLVLAIDSFPYLVESQLQAMHVCDIARILQPGGQFLIMNYSYRGDLARDRVEVARLAGKHSLEVLRNGTGGLSLWDGRAFLLEKRK